MDTVSYQGKQIRMIPASAVEDAVAELFVKANYTLTKDVTDCIAAACGRERCPLAKRVLDRLLDNVAAAREMDVPVSEIPYSVSGAYEILKKDFAL